MSLGKLVEPVMLYPQYLLNLRVKNKDDVMNDSEVLKSLDDVEKLMKQTKDVIVFDKKVKGGYVTLNDVQGEIEVYVSRLRQDVSVENGFSYWCAADNLRFGVAGNVYKIIRSWMK